MNNKNKNYHMNTRVIHGGQSCDPLTGAVMPPIYATSTFKQTSPGEHTGYEYSRSKNPSRAALEQSIANLESGNYGYAFASGMAAISAIIELLSPGDHVLVLNDVYGGTYRLFEHVRRRSAGLSFSFVDFTHKEHWQTAITSKTKMIWVESPSNPLLKVIPLADIAAYAKAHHIITVADNTFATPIIQRPLELGFDIVMHSATKYLNGHSDVIAGVAAIGDNPELAHQLHYLQNASGGIAGPFDSYLILRGIKTLALRMEQHSQNAMYLASQLERHPKVNHVYYPGLPSHPQYPIATAQMKGFGGMITCELKADLEETKTILKRCELFTLAESLGGVESLISHPATMTHAALPKAYRDKMGIQDNLIRLSVGIEAVDDLWADLKSALR